MAQELLKIDEQLSLVASRLSDVEEYYDLIEANRDYLAQAGEHIADYTFGDAVQEQVMLGNAVLAGRALDYWIMSDGRKVGAVGMHILGRAAERNVWVAESEQGQGFATKATKHLTEHAVVTRGLRSVRAYILPSNEKSIRRVQREGAVRIGKTAREVAGVLRPIDIWEVYNSER